MFVRSLMDKDVIYRKGGFAWVIKARTVTLIDETKVSAKEIKGLYGDRIIIISKDSIEDEVAKPIVERQIAELDKKPSDTLLDETLIDDIIAQIEAEDDNDKPAQKTEVPNGASLGKDSPEVPPLDEKDKIKLEENKEEEKAKLKELTEKMVAEKEKAEAKKVEEKTAKARKGGVNSLAKKTSRRGRKAKANK